METLGFSLWSGLLFLRLTVDLHILLCVLVSGLGYPMLWARGKGKESDHPKPLLLPSLTEKSAFNCLILNFCGAKPGQQSDKQEAHMAGLAYSARAEYYGQETKCSRGVGGRKGETGASGA